MIFASCGYLVLTPILLTTIGSKFKEGLSSSQQRLDGRIFWSSSRYAHPSPLPRPPLPTRLPDSRRRRLRRTRLLLSPRPRRLRDDLHPQSQEPHPQSQIRHLPLHGRRPLSPRPPG